jgi:hypothetical protein
LMKSYRVRATRRLPTSIRSVIRDVSFYSRGMTGKPEPARQTP